MTDFKIRSGLSTDLFINGDSKSGIIDGVVLENGCWYLCTNTAELFLCVQQADGLTLRRINEKTDLGTDSDGTNIDAAVIIALREEVNNIKECLDFYAKTDDIPSLEGYATEQYVLDAIDNHEALAEVKTKLDEEVLPIIPTIQETIVPAVEKVETEVIPTIQELAEKAATKEWVHEQNFVTETFVTEKISDIKIPEEYVTESELEDKGYLTEHQSLDAYATKEFVAEAINDIEIHEPEKVDLGNYYTKQEVDKAIANVEVDLSGYAKTDDIPDVSNFITEIPSNYVTDEELTAKGYITEHQNLSEYAKKSELFSKSYNDLIDTPIIPSTEGLASEAYVDSAIANIDFPEQDLSDYYTKTETESAISSAISNVKPDIDLTPYALKSDLEVKANEIPFTTNRFVSNAIGSFTAGESVKGLTVAELFAKLLGLTDVPKGVVENIIVNEYGLYQFSDSLDVEYIEFTHTIFESADEYTSAPVESTFYQYTYVNDDGEEVTESGYQHHTLAQEFIYYMVMLPSSLVIGENVKVQAWSNKDGWMDTITSLECDPAVIAANFDDEGLEMPVIPDGYTMWVDFSNVNPGNKIRYVIIE